MRPAFSQQTLPITRLLSLELLLLLLLLLWCTFTTIISRHRPFGVIQETQSLINSTLLSTNLICLWAKIPVYNSFYRSANIVRMIKCKRLRWAGHVVIREEGKILPNFNRYTYRKATFREVLGIDGRTILERILKKCVSVQGIGLIWLSTGIIWEPLWMWHWTSGFHKPWS